MPKKNSVAAISLENSLLGILEPVIAVLDQDHPAELGHEYPSRKDGMLRVLLNNFCRDVYQQIHGVRTQSYTFNGIKDNFDRACNSLAKLESDYRLNGDADSMDTDPAAFRLLNWYTQAETKLHACETMLTDCMAVYKSVTNEDWVYVAPGSRTVTAKINGADTAQSIRAKLAAKAAEINKRKSAKAVSDAPINQTAAA